MEKNNFLVKKVVKEIDFIDLESIPIDLRENEVYITKPRKVKNFYQHLRNIMNERFVREQLGLINQLIDYRDLWYSIVDYRMKGKIDISLNNPFIATEKAVKEFCLKLMDYYSIEHWSMVMDKLSMESKGKAIIYDLELNGTILTVKTIQNFKDIPFFILICEKETVLKQTLKALKDLGYRHGFYGINTGGVGTSAVARLLIEYRDSISNKFYIFSLTDFDLAGLKIFFDFRKYFKVERCGLNSQMIKFLDLDFSLLTSEYTSQKSLNKQKQECLNMLERLNLSFFEIIYYLQEIDKCSKNKIELNSLSAFRSETDKLVNPCIDYANYIEYLLENNKRIYDLNRFKQPLEQLTNSTNSIIPNLPNFIQKAKKEINELIFNEIDDIDFWIKNIQETYDSFKIFNSNNESKKDNILRNKCSIFIEKNKDYDKSLKNVFKTIKKQDKSLEFMKKLKDKLISKNVRFEKAIINQKIKDLEIYKEKKKIIKKIIKKIHKIIK